MNFLQSLQFQIPNLPVLTSGISSILNVPEGNENEITIVDRQFNPYYSSFPSEIVTCRLADGRKMKFFCKYENGCLRQGDVNRGGIEYEARVYTEVLQPLSINKPKFYGLYSDSANNVKWLLIEYLDHAGGGKNTEQLKTAACRIGHFHKITEKSLSNINTKILRKHDGEYYLNYLRSASDLTSSSYPNYPWLKILFARSETLVDLLTAMPPTVIHGEYYSKNFLVYNQNIYPIDWESAALGVGETDLAALTDGRDLNITRQCKLAYQKARWCKEEPPENFPFLFDVVCLYWQFRWLGDAHISPDNRAEWRFDVLHKIGQKLELI